MTRVKRGTTILKRRRNVLKQVKGYRFGRSKKERQAREAIQHAGQYAFVHRRTKKRDARSLWTLRINAALRAGGFPSYSKFIGTLTKKGIKVDRKVMADMAMNHPESFKRFAESVN